MSCWFWYLRFRYIPVTSSAGMLLPIEARVFLWFSEDSWRTNWKEDGVRLPLIKSKQAGRTRENGT